MAGTMRRDLLSHPDPRRVAAAFLNTTDQTAGRTKTAGEIRFIKDRGTGKDEWAWGGFPPSRRELKVPGWEWKAENAKPLAKILRSTLAALGHASSANQTFTKLKSVNISPDGNLGGKGYIQGITDAHEFYKLKGTHPKSFCVPEKKEARQKGESLVPKWLTAFKNRLHQKPVVLVVDAMNDIFPCPPKK